MAKPRVFVSSTYYDLRHIRDRLEDFIQSFGYEPVLFESGDIPFDHEKALDESCYSEIGTCHILVLIVGGRYGSPASGESPPEDSKLDDFYARYNSITRKEYEAARQQDIPIYIFVEGGVLSEYETYRRNKNAETVEYAHVDSVNVYRLLDDIMAQSRNNLVRGFDSFDDISSWLREQWAGLFEGLLSRRGQAKTLSDLAAQLVELQSVTGALKDYSETIIKSVNPQNAAQVIEEQERKTEEELLSRRFLRGATVKRLVNATGKTPLELWRFLAKSTSAAEFFEELNGHFDTESKSFVFEDIEFDGTRKYDEAWFERKKRIPRPK